MSDNMAAIAFVSLRLLTWTEENCRWGCEV